MSAVDFFLQLGPDFKDYTDVFVKNGFNDVETISTMHIQEDLDTMFSGETMPLGHRRKIETAVKNMKSAIDTGSHEYHLPIGEKVQNVEMKPSLLKMKENKQEEISKLEAKLELVLSRQKDMGKFVPMPEQDGPFKNKTCSVCHIRGHRTDGNRDRSHCDKEPCSSWTFVGERKKINMKKQGLRMT